MGRTIDERVVEMRFDNKQFESETKTTMNTLSQLKKSLDFSKSGQALNQLDKSIKAFSFEGMAAGIASLEKRFSTMGIVGMRVIQNLTDSVMSFVNRGLRFMEDAIVSGGVRRAMNLEKAHFQLQNIIGDEARVQEVMDAANKSVDGTAYSFDVAAKAASQFYASGVTDMQSMDQALAGLAGTTATFSADYEQMSMIWTQVAGQGRLMGDQLLQLSTRGANAAVEISKFMNGVNDGSIQASDSVKAAVGEISKSTENTEADIRDFVSKGKINFDIFAEAMNHAFGDSAQKANETFDGALANIKSAFARIGAGFISPLIAQNNELVELFNTIRLKVNDIKKVLVFDEAIGNTTALSKKFTDSVLKMAKSLSEFIKNADIRLPLSIFLDGIEVLTNLFKSLGTVIKPVFDALSNTFTVPLESLKKFTSRLVLTTRDIGLTETASKNLYDTFKGVADILKVLISGVTKLISPMLSLGNSMGESILGVTGNIGRALSAFAEWIETAEIVQDITNRVSFAFAKISDVALTVRNKVSDMISTIRDFSSTQSSVSGVYAVFDSLRNMLKDILSIFSDMIGRVGPKITRLFGIIGDTLSSLGKVLGESIRKDGFRGFYDILNSGLLVAFGSALTKLVFNFTDFTKSATSMFSGVKSIFSKLDSTFETATKALSGLKDVLKAYQNEISSKILLNIAFAVGILSASLVALALIDSDKLTAGIGSITFLFGELIGSFMIFQKVLNPSLKSITSAGTALVTLSAAILVLSSALVKISTIDPDRMVQSLKGITVLIGEMSIAAIAISKFGGKIKTGSLGLIAFASAIYILASSVRKLGDLDIPTLQKGISSIGLLMTELAAFMIGAQFGKFKPSQALAIAGLSAALLILVEAVERFGVLDIHTLQVGIISVGAVLAEMAAFGIASGMSKHILSSAASLLIMAKAMDMMVSPMKEFGNFSISEMAKSLIMLAGALAEITIAMRTMPATAPLIGAGLVIFASAIGILVDSLMVLGTLSWGEIAKSLVTLAASLVVLATAMAAMKGSLSGSAAMLVMAASLKIFVPVLKTLGAMSWKQIAAGLVALAGAFTVIGAAGLLLGPVVPTILGLSAAMALLGASVLSVGAGILAFGVGLGVLSEALRNESNALVDTVIILITGVLEAIRQCVPDVVETCLVVVDEVLRSLVEHVPSIIKSLANLIVDVINGIASEMPKVVQSVINLIGVFFSSITKAIKNMDVSVLQDGLAGIGIMTAIFGGMALLSTMAPAAMSGILSFGALIAELTLVLAAAGAINKIPGLNWLVGQGGEFLEAIGAAIGKFVGGIVGGGMEAIAARLPKIGSDLSSFMGNAQGFLTGASQINSKSIDGIKSLAQAVVILTGADILNGLTSWFTGGSSLQKFGKELEAFAPSFVSFSNQISKVDASVVQASADAALALAEMANTLPNSGGLAAKIFGDNTLSDFGRELQKFAPYLSSYSNQIKGIDPSAVQASAEAAKILADMANTLPNSGGLAAKIFGDNTLSDFGRELQKFGPPLGAYCGYVKDVKAESVQASAQAAQIMADMASTLPNSGGLSALIFGDNTLSDFGRELQKFGPHIKAYSDSISGLDAGVVVASANAAKALSELANNLPNSGGLISLFTGDNGLDTFGKQLSKLGEGLAAYYEKISSISVETINGASNALKNLVLAVGTAQGISADAVVKIVKNLNTAATTGISQFLSAFQNAGGQIVSVVTTFANNATNALNFKVSGFTTAGNKSVTAYLTAIRNQFATATSVGQQLVTKVLTPLQQKVNEFKIKGTSSATSYLTGFRSQYSIATSVGQQIVNNVLNALQQKVNEFKIKGTSSATSYTSGISSQNSSASNAGSALARNAADGLGNVASTFGEIGRNCGSSFCSGVRSYEGEAASAGAAIGRAAYRAAKAEMKINSPSKKFMELGEGGGEGFALGLDKSKILGERSAKQMAEDSFNAMADSVSLMSSLIDSSMDINPTITPNLNLDNIRTGADEISDMFNKAIQTTAVNVEGLNMRMSNARNPIADPSTGYQNGEQTGSTITFNQYNTSPKALSRVEIYRQTQNQITQFEQVVGSKK